mgnify:CR=1 FL=1
MSVPQASSPNAVAVRFSKVSRHFGDVRAVDQVDLDIYDGEFFSMLGPSGSGKTTCLRLIAGFEQPSAGSIQLYGQEMVGVPPFLRDVNTVFQDYALFPHLTVLQNCTLAPMNTRGLGKDEAERLLARRLQPLLIARRLLA